MSLPRVAIVSTGSANLASVAAALVRAGLEPVVLDVAEPLERYNAVVLPGVGAFGAAMGHLNANGWTAPLLRYIESGAPFLAICLGLQLLAEGSDESPGVPGLGVIPGIARALPAGQRIPQMGWNRVIPRETSAVLEAGWAYFANSYALSTAPAGWQVAEVDYGGPSVAAIARGAQLACQFHPELSGAWGASLLRRWSAQC